MLCCSCIFILKYNKKVQLLLYRLVHLVYEKRQGLRTMMRMHGLGDVIYWVVTYIYYLLLYVVYIIILIVSSTVLNWSLVTLNSYGMWPVCFGILNFYLLFINRGILLLVTSWAVIVDKLLSWMFFVLNNLIRVKGRNKTDFLCSDPLIIHQKHGYVCMCIVLHQSVLLVLLWAQCVLQEPFYQAPRHTFCCWIGFPL